VLTLIDAERRLAGKLIGQLRHYLAHRVLYDKATASTQPANQSNPALPAVD
jgi:hypothetical protein